MVKAESRIPLPRLLQAAVSIIFVYIDVRQVKAPFKLKGFSGVSPCVYLTQNIPDPLVPSILLP